MHALRIPLAIGTALASLTLPLSARAQEHALPRYEPAPVGDRFFAVHSPYVPGHLALHAGAILDYGKDPFVFRETDTGDVASRLVDHQLLLHTGLTFAMWNRVAVSAAMPFALSQGGDDPRYLGVTLRSPDQAAVGDLRASARVAIVGRHNGAFQFGLGGHVFVPTGDGQRLMSDGAVRGMPYAAIGGRFAPAGRAIWSVSGGPELRPSRALHGSEQGTMIRGGAGLAYQIGPRRDVQLGGELHGYAVTREPSSRTTGLELLLSAKLRFLDDFEAGLGAGPGVVGGVGTPSVRGLLSIAYTPRLSEERDTPPAPARPAPEPAPAAPPPPLDSDGDGVPDAEDACPSERGEAEGARRGCPKPPEPPTAAEEPAPPPPKAPTAPSAKATIEEQRIAFALDSTEIDAGGRAKIQRVAKVLAENPNARVVVRGHSDDTGPIAYNQQLSERRSLAVKDALLQAGVAKDRLDTEALGPSEPLEATATTGARAKNRRVDFRVVE